MTTNYAALKIFRREYALAETLRYALRVFDRWSPGESKKGGRFEGAMELLREQPLGDFDKVLVIYEALKADTGGRATSLGEDICMARFALHFGEESSHVFPNRYNLEDILHAPHRVGDTVWLTGNPLDEQLGQFLSLDRPYKIEEIEEFSNAFGWVYRVDGHDDVISGGWFTSTPPATAED
jgi:hypothetical protein